MIHPISNSNNNTPEFWNEIEKVKTSLYPKQPTITDALSNSIPPKTPALNVLEAIAKRNQQHYSKGQGFGLNPHNSPPIHDNLMSLVCSKDLIRVAFQQLSKNKGALTPGTSPDTADEFSEEKVEQLHKALKNNTFKWSPIRRIFIPKPGKAKKRPLGIPNFTDKIVQCIIKIILTSIYEPEFGYVNCNYGFRPNMGTMNPIRRIRFSANGMNYAIEADVLGAYDNVDHKILKAILRKRIKDEKFLTLIYDGLKCALMTNGVYYDSFLGTPQGGIASPILFNIYMNEFDKFILSYTNDIVEKHNQNKTSTTSTENNPEYNCINKALTTNKKILDRIDKQTPKQYLEDSHASAFDYIDHYKIKCFEGILEPDTLIDKNIQSIYQFKPSQEEKQLFSKYEAKKETQRLNTYSSEEQNTIKKFNNIQATKSRVRTKIKIVLNSYPQLISEFRENSMNKLRKTIKQLEIIRLVTVRLDPNRVKPSFLYLRYADDWILFTRGNLEQAISLKEVAEKWLLKELKLSLSQEKTLITHIQTEKAHFLGFEIFRQTNSLIKKKQYLKQLPSPNPKVSTSSGSESIKPFTPSGLETGETGELDKLNLKTYLQRYGSGVQIMPDIERLTKRFRIKNYISNRDFPLSIGCLTILEPHQIIEKFNQFMIGIGNYYATEISRLSALNK
jgi:retron-type reverse transcriptase